MVLRRRALRVQAAYYLATGLWPLLSRRSFEAVTGKKVDWWLVQMVGLLAATIGASIAVSLKKTSSTASEPSGDGTLVLATLGAASFAAIDVTQALRRRISPVYLADAAIELALIAVLLA